MDKGKEIINEPFWMHPDNEKENIGNNKMNGIYIKGISMPTSCRSCRFAGFGGRRCELNVCMFTGESQPTLSQERMSTCPLVPVPPHGDLIDKKTVSENLASVLNKKNPPFSYPNWNDAIVAMLTAPIIIPADKEH